MYDIFSNIFFSEVTWPIKVIKCGVLEKKKQKGVLAIRRIFSLVDMIKTPNFQIALMFLKLVYMHSRQRNTFHRLRAKKGPAPPPPLGNFADISYLKEKFKPHLLRDVCTLCSGALVSDSLLHMLL